MQMVWFSGYKEWFFLARRRVTITFLAASNSSLMGPGLMVFEYVSSKLITKASLYSISILGHLPSYYISIFSGNIIRNYNLICNTTTIVVYVFLFNMQVTK